MLHHRHQLDMREAELVGVRDELARELPPRGRAATIRVHLVDRERCFSGFDATATLDPGAVGPGEARAVDVRRVRRRHLGVKAYGSALSRVTRRRPRPRTCSGRLPPLATMPSQIPEEPTSTSGSAPSLQWFQSPTTETARALGAQTANRTPSSTTMGAESLVEPLVPALAREVQIELTSGVLISRSSMRRALQRVSDPVGPVAELVSELVDELLSSKRASSRSNPPRCGTSCGSTASRGSRRGTRRGTTIPSRPAP